MGGIIQESFIAINDFEHLSSACPNIELVYHNHCYYDPQVLQSSFSVDQVQ